MKVTHTATYDAPVADVHAMLLDPAAREFIANRTGGTEISVSVKPAGGGHVVTVDQLQPTEGVPSFAKKFAGETTRAIQTETWSSPTHGELVVETPGRPTRVHGTYTLTTSGATTVQTFEGEVKAKVPLIKDKLEKLIAELFLQGKDLDAAAAAAWLGGER